MTIQRRIARGAGGHQTTWLGQVQDKTFQPSRAWLLLIPRIQLNGFSVASISRSGAPSGAAHAGDRPPGGGQRAGPGRQQGDAYFSLKPHLAAELVRIGAGGLVRFNSVVEAIRGLDDECPARRWVAPRAACVALTEY
jgi:hypothetical protein